jgi:drug/metabolite transporter (DMT)-like permease
VSTPHPVDDHNPAAAGAPLLAATIAVTAWGIGPLFVRAIGTSGLTVATWRMGCGTPVMYMILWLRGGRMTRNVLKVAAPAGLLFAADIAFGFSSYQHTTIARSTLIGALSPLLVLLVSNRLFGERLRRVDLLWFMAALGGTAVVVLAGPGGGRASFYGDALAAASLVVWTIYFLYLKRRRLDGVPAFAYMTAVIMWGAIALVPYALLTSSDLGAVRGTDFVWLFALILGPGALGHGLMAWATRYLNVNVSSLMTLVGPVVSTVGARICFGESLSAGQLAGGLAVLVAIGLVLVGHAAVPLATAADSIEPAEPF